MGEWHEAELHVKSPQLSKAEFNTTLKKGLSAANIDVLTGNCWICSQTHHLKADEANHAMTSPEISSRNLLKSAVLENILMMHFKSVLFNRGFMA